MTVGIEWPPFPVDVLGFWAELTACTASPTSSKTSHVSNAPPPEGRTADSWSKSDGGWFALDFRGLEP